MHRINLNQDVKPLSEFRSNAKSFLDQVKTTKRPLVITQHGKSSAVLLDVTEYEDLMERIELLQDINLAEKQIEKGEGLSHENVKSMIFSGLS